MASPNIPELTAAASRRRSAKAALGGPAKTAPAASGPSPGAPPVPPPAPAGAPPTPGVVAGLHAATGAPPPHAYMQHAMNLSKAATDNGAPALASTIRAVAAVPHPLDKVQVAKNYLSTVPPQVAQQHQHMFTKTLMGGI